MFVSQEDVTELVAAADGVKAEDIGVLRTGFTRGGTGWALVRCPLATVKRRQEKVEYQ